MTLTLALALALTLIRSVLGLTLRQADRSLMDMVAAMLSNEP